MRELGLGKFKEKAILPYIPNECQAQAKVFYRKI